MIDPEKVIKALECCDDSGSPDCEHCPYMDDDFVGTCRSRKPLFRDAVWLLKPRVLTLDELHDGRPVFVEEHHDAASDTCGYNGYNVVQGIFRQWVDFLDDISYPVGSYDWNWRCWSARPSDEQRKAVKWDAAD